MTKEKAKEKIQWSNVIGIKGSIGLALQPKKHTTYSPPEGVIPKGESSKVVGDSMDGLLFSNCSQTGSFIGYPTLASLMQKSENRIAVEESVNEIFRKGYEFKSNDSEKDRSEIINQLTADVSLFNVNDVLNKLGILGEGMGIGHIMPIFKGDDLDEERSKPLYLDNRKIKKGSLIKFVAIDPLWVTSKIYNAIDPTDEYFYKPEMWYMLGKSIHATRINQLVPYPLPDLLKPIYNFGGLSLIQMMLAYVNNWEKVRDEIPEIVKTFRTYILKTDMVRLAESKEEFDARIKAFTYGKDNHGVLSIDMADEDLSQLNTNLSELSDLLNDYLKQLCIPSRLSSTKLTGIQPSGLNSDGEGEQNALHETIASKQEKVYKPIIEWISKILMLNRFGEIYDDIFVDFVPLKEMSEQEISLINKTNAETNSIYINDSVFMPEQVAKIVSSNKISGYSGVKFEGDMIDEEDNTTAEEENEGSSDSKDE